jgi:phosphomannomutase
VVDESGSVLWPDQLLLFLAREVAMLRESAALAGEMSGHIVYPDCWNSTDDALQVAVRVLNSVSGMREGLGEFRRALPRTWTTPEWRMPCPEHRKQAIVEEVAARLAAAGAELTTVDGIRVTTSDGWWLLRASGTESKLTARCEASDAPGLARLQAELERQLRLCGLDSGV